jgi:hypothetical protein
MAATEWLRKERDAIIRENTNPLAYLYLKVRILAAPISTQRHRKYIDKLDKSACSSCCIIEPERCTL